MNESRWMMKRKMLLLSLIGFTLSALATVVPGANQGSAQAYEVEIDAAAREQVLNSTVRITIITQKSSTYQANDTEVKEVLVSGSNALGTVVQDGDENYIVTHDHWSHLVSKLHKVQFHNTQGVLLVELERSVFYGLIRYRDGGTMVLEAPDEVATRMKAVEPSRQDTDKSVQAGDELLMAYWNPGAEQHLSVERVAVTLVEDHNGLATMKLQTLSGRAVVLGNSGGGVFKDGRLVANMWSTVVVQNSNSDDTGESSPTDLSRAAQFNLEEESSDDLAVERNRFGGGEF